MTSKFLVLIGLLVLSCAGGESPHQAADGYLSALSRLDFGAASRFVADEGRANLESLQNLYASLSPDEQKKFQVRDWAVSGETVNGDTATVDFVFDQVKKGQLSLHRVNGIWRVDSRKTF
jgi:hypothetical protein